LLFPLFIGPRLSALLDPRLPESFQVFLAPYIDFGEMNVKTNGTKPFDSLPDAIEITEGIIQMGLKSNASDTTIPLLQIFDEVVNFGEFIHTD
jgi:hypothetical protein